VIGTVPFNDLAWQWRQIADDLEAELPAFWRSCAYSGGDYVDHFESEFASFLGTEHVVGVNSGTSALHLSLIGAGVRPGDKVLVPSMTFVATAWAVAYVGAVPVFCDVEPDTGTLDAADAARRLDEKVTAIVPVHLYGQVADLTAVIDLAARNGLSIVEDAAQAAGAFHQGAAAGTVTGFGAYSFYPGKNLGAVGEAGAVVANDPEAAHRIRNLRNHAQSRRYVHDEIGFNYRMDGLQALVLRHKLARLKTWTALRKEVANIYLRELAALPLDLPVPKRDHVFHLFVVRTERRDDLKAHLEARGIATGLHYPVPLSRQPCFQQLGHSPHDFPQADDFATRGLSLPLFAGMTRHQVDRVIDEVHAFFTG
jgi:dTDP-4-amino-4,6-dideoxygalactose transaminase